MGRIARMPALQLLFSTGFFGVAVLVAGKFCLAC
jgi:hypothetical protein